MNNLNQQVSEIEVSYKPFKIDNSQVTSSNEVVAIVRKLWNPNTIEMQEEVKVVLLNNSNSVLGVYSLSKGGITASLVDVRLILSVALKCLATGIVLIHNHPSGSLKPSTSDITIVKKLKDAGKLLDICLFDSIIITKDSYMSFNDDGLL